MDGEHVLHTCSILIASGPWKKSYSRCVTDAFIDYTIKYC